VNKVIIEDNIECAFANVEISLRIFLTLMVTNCAPARSFSQMKRIKNIQTEQALSYVEYTKFICSSHLDKHQLVFDNTLGTSY
jgi:hypothetical protein